MGTLWDEHDQISAPVLGQILCQMLSHAAFHSSLARSGGNNYPCFAEEAEAQRGGVAHLCSHGSERWKLAHRLPGIAGPQAATEGTGLTG